MPCQQPHQQHIWPSAGHPDIHFCENTCGYCKNSSGDLLGYTWANWWSLWEHVYRVHLDRKHGTHKGVELIGPTEDELPEDLLAPVSKERRAVRTKLRQALVAAAAVQPSASNFIPINPQTNTAVSSATSSANPPAPHLPFAPITKETQTEAKEQSSKQPQTKISERPQK